MMNYVGEFLNVLLIANSVIIKKTSKNLCFVHLNINWVRSKFESVQEIIQNTFDISLVCENKIASFFSNKQLFIVTYMREGYSSMQINTQL